MSDAVTMEGNIATPAILKNTARIRGTDGEFSMGQVTKMHAFEGYARDIHLIVYAITCLAAAVIIDANMSMCSFLDCLPPA